MSDDSVAAAVVMELAEVVAMVLMVLTVLLAWSSRPEKLGLLIVVDLLRAVLKAPPPVWALLKQVQVLRQTPTRQSLHHQHRLHLLLLLLHLLLHFILLLLLFLLPLLTITIIPTTTTLPFDISCAVRSVRVRWPPVAFHLAQ